MIHIENQQAFITIPENVPSLYHEDAFEFLNQMSDLLSLDLKCIIFSISYSKEEPPSSSFLIRPFTPQRSKLSDLFMQLEQKGIPLIAIIQGHCTGTRFALATLCHYRIGISSDLMLGPGSPFQNHFSISGTAIRLVYLLGLAKTIQWMFYTPYLSESEAFSFSFLHQLTKDKEEAMKVAQEWVQQQSLPLSPPRWYSHLFPLWEREVNQFLKVNAHVGSRIEVTHHPARFALAALYHGLHLPFEKAVALEEKYFVKAFSKQSDCYFALP